MASRTGSEGKAVGIWLRVSTEDQVRGESPETHEARARHYADMRGWQVAQVYRLDGFSGKSVASYPETKRMLADIRAGVITGLVFSKLARFARNTRELLEFADVFRACGADMISLAESIDTSTPAGRFFFTNLAALAQWEREELVDRVRASVPFRAKLGKRIGGQAPLGYRWAENKLEVDPAEAPVRVLIYELFAQHRRRKTVARILNERGYRTRAGAPFSDSTITRLIEDPTAKGWHRANHTRMSDDGKRCEPKPESEWVWTQVEPLISEELWDQCNELVGAQKAGRRPRMTRTTPHLFAGFAICKCGEKMYVPSNQTKYVCRNCRNKIPIDDLEAIFHHQLEGFLLSRDELDAHLSAVEEAARERVALIEKTEAELRKVDAEEDVLFRLVRDGELPTGDFRRRHQPISERRQQLAEELPRLRAELDVLRINNLSKEQVALEAKDLWSRWDQMDFDAKRSIVEAITDRIVIGVEDVEMSLLDLPRNGDNMATQPSRRAPP